MLSLKQKSCKYFKKYLFLRENRFRKAGVSIKLLFGSTLPHRLCASLQREERRAVCVSSLPHQELNPRGYLLASLSEHSSGHESQHFL